MNIWDILILLAVGAALVLAARTAGKRKGGCGCCPAKGTGECHCADKTDEKCLLSKDGMVQ